MLRSSAGGKTWQVWTTAASGKEWVPEGNYARRPVVAFIEHITTS